MTTFAERFKDEGRQDMLLDALNIKFQSVPQEIKDKISTVRESLKLKDLHRYAILSNNISEFQDKLNRITG